MSQTSPKRNATDAPTANGQLAGDDPMGIEGAGFVDRRRGDDKKADDQKADQLKADKLKYVNSVLTEIMATVPDSIILCTKEFTVRGANTAACSMLSHSLKELRETHINDYFPGLSDYLASLPDGNFFLEQQSVVLGDGSTLPAEVRGHKGPVGRKSNYVLVFQDISSRLKAEESRKKTSSQMDEARRLEAIGALSSGIAHEINTPIQYLGDNLEFLGESLTLVYGAYQRYEKLRQAAEEKDAFVSELQEIEAFNASINLANVITEVQSALDESREGIKQVRDIILLMKEFAHPGTGNKDETDINLIIKNVLAISRNKSKNAADVELKLDETLPDVPCRKGQVQQVILNIVLNAIDAIIDAGDERGKILIQTIPEKDYVWILISDTGSGIPYELRQKVFDPFFTTKPVGKGTGQGLALAKDCIINGHGGKLTLTNVEGYTTTFVIALPLQNDALNEPLEDD